MGRKSKRATCGSTRAPRVLKGGDTGPAIVPGKPDESLLVDAIRYGETYQMPPKSQLPAEEIATLVEWVRMRRALGHATADRPQRQQPAGAFDLQARAGHWSFQPLAAVEPPQSATRLGSRRRSIDSFWRGSKRPAWRRRRRPTSARCCAA